MTSYSASYQSGYYYCPSGGSLSGSTCTTSGSYAASYQSAYYTCPNGGDLVGSTCTTINKLVAVQAGGTNVMVVDSDGNLNAKGTITGGVASPDYAENIGVSDATIEAADVVAMDPNRIEWAIKATVPYGTTVLGIISTSPGFLTNAGGVDTPSPEDQRPLALSGRVPVKVSTINGVIRQGDYLTSSSIPGVAMKATGPGAVIGVAMADFTGEGGGTYTCGEGFICGKVLLFINPSASNPGVVELAMQGGNPILNTLTINGALNASAINVGGLLSAGELEVIGNATIAGNLLVEGLTEVQDIYVNGRLVMVGNAPQVSAGEGLQSTVEGTDGTGTVAVTVSETATLVPGVLARVTFSEPYGTDYKIVLTPTNGPAADLRIYVVKTDKGFDVVSRDAPSANTQYEFDYITMGWQLTKSRQ